MSSLRLCPSSNDTCGHSGEVFTCAYTPDGSTLFSGGWDGELRLWETTAGAPLGTIRASAKPISAIAVAPDGKQFMTGCLEGFLTCWDSFKRHRQSSFVAHGRPISVITVDPSGQSVVTASWDGCINIWDPQQTTAPRGFSGHSDIVAGCRFTPDGKLLLSWSYDGTMNLWDLDRPKLVGQFAKQDDRITAGAVSPDGRLVASGTRGGVLKLWNLRSQQEICSSKLVHEIRGCFFLLDGTSLLVVDCAGHVTLHALPELGVRAECMTHLSIICAELSPAGNQLALGCNDGQVRFLTIEECASSPLVVLAKRSSRRTATRLQRLFGRSRLTFAYRCTCPACRQEFEMLQADPSQTLPCPNCNRRLRVADVLLPNPLKTVSNAEHRLVSKSEQAFR
jgi:WD40 repeat protein/uncharacterized protein YbaR (Trm112 family)